MEAERSAGHPATPSGEGAPPLTLYLVKRLEQVIRSLLDEALRPFGVTTLQYTALSVLERRDGLSSAQLARRAFVRPQSMHEMVLALGERGLIERRHTASNQRVLAASLTETGRALLAECRPVVQEVEDQLLAGMPATYHQEFRQALVQGHDTLATWARHR